MNEKISDLRDAMHKMDGDLVTFMLYLTDEDKFKQDFTQDCAKFLNILEDLMDSNYISAEAIDSERIRLKEE